MCDWAFWVHLEVPFLPWLVEVIYCHEGDFTESLQSLQSDIMNLIFLSVFTNIYLGSRLSLGLHHSSLPVTEGI